MKYANLSIFFVYTILLIIHNVNSVEDNKIVAARIESCPGCSLNRLPEVKQFIYTDVPKYDNVEFKKIHGALPELLFLNKNDEIVEKIALSSLNREECNNLLKDKGFEPKNNDKQEF